MENSGHNVIEYQQLKSFIVQIVAISLCKLWIFTLTFSKKNVYFKAFSLTGRRGITNTKPRANALGYELLPFTFPLRAGDRWFRALGDCRRNKNYFPIFFILSTCVLITSSVDLSVEKTELRPWASWAGSPV